MRIYNGGSNWANLIAFNCRDQNSDNECNYDCECDYAEFTGNTLPPTISSTGNQVFILYTSLYSCPGTCGNPDGINNIYNNKCDYDNNNCGCGWDRGDCCIDDNKVTDACTYYEEWQCECLNPNRGSGKVNKTNGNGNGGYGKGFSASISFGKKMPIIHYESKFLGVVAR